MSHSEPVFLKGKTPEGQEVVLRPLCQDDLPRLQRWINDPDNRQQLAVVFPTSMNQEEKWLEWITTREDLPSDIVFAICADGKHIGVVGLHRINYLHRFAETGVNIGEAEYRGQGIGSTAKQMVVDYAFGELNFNSLTTGVYGHNQRSQRMQEKCGWKQAGCYPRRFFKNGQWTDLLLYYILRENWEQQRQE